MSVVPVIAIITVALIQVLGRLLHKWRPKWTEPFIPEPSPLPELASRPGTQRVGWVISLLAVSIVGFAAELIKIIPNGSHSSNYILLGSWVSGNLACRLITS